MLAMFRQTRKNSRLKTNTFDLITIAFGLRNVTDKDAALRSMLRVLKPGGRLLVLEFSKPEAEMLSKAYGPLFIPHHAAYG